MIRTRAEEILHCTDIRRLGVQVVTVLIAGGRCESRVFGGPLDGEVFAAESDPKSQHERACHLARSANWRHR